MVVVSWLLVGRDAGQLKDSACVPPATGTTITVDPGCKFRGEGGVQTNRLP